MAYAAWTKGSSALLIAVRALAIHEGVDGMLRAEWQRSQPGLGARSESAVAGNAKKAWRFVGEMEEIAQTFAAAGLPAGFHEACAVIYERLGRYKDTPVPPPMAEAAATRCVDTDMAQFRGDSFRQLIARLRRLRDGGSGVGWRVSRSTRPARTRASHRGARQVALDYADSLMMKRLRLPILGLALLLGCGGANNNVVPPEDLVAGTWRFNYTNMSGSLGGLSVTCTPVTLDFSITQELFTFSGVQVGSGTITCSSVAGVVTNRVITEETITRGQIDGRTIVFRLGQIPGSHTAEVTRTSIIGTAQWVLTVGGGTLILTGQFSAARLVQ